MISNITEFALERPPVWDASSQTQLSITVDGEVAGSCTVGNMISDTVKRRTGISVCGSHCDYRHTYVVCLIDGSGVGDGVDDRCVLVVVSVYSERSDVIFSRYAAVVSPGYDREWGSGSARQGLVNGDSSVVLIDCEKFKCRSTAQQLILKSYKIIKYIQELSTSSCLSYACACTYHTTNHTYNYDKIGLIAVYFLMMRWDTQTTPKSPESLSTALSVVTRVPVEAELPTLVSYGSFWKTGALLFLVTLTSNRAAVYKQHNHNIISHNNQKNYNTVSTVFWFLLEAI